MDIQKMAMKKCDWQLIKSGMSKDINRQAIQLVHFGNGYIESTDGRVLFRLALEHSIPVGAYKILSEEKLCVGLVNIVFELTDVQYPETDRVIPKTGSEYVLLNITDNSMSISIAMFKLYEYKKTALNYALIEKISKISETWKVFIESDNAPALFTTDTFTVVIMPIVVEKARVETVKIESLQFNAFNHS